MKYYFYAIMLVAVEGTSCVYAQSNNDGKRNPKSLMEVADSIKTLNISELVVMGRRPEAVVSADKISFLPASAISGSGGNLYEALTSLPGVSVDAKGIVSVNGKSGVTLMMDGRKIIFSGDALMNFLRALPVGNVDKIEITSAPSAKNDAAGATTVINIKRKCIRDRGFTLNLSGNSQLWKACRGYTSMLADYNRGQAHLSLGYAFMAAHNPSELFTDRPYLSGDSRLLQDYKRHRRDLMHNVSLACDYGLSPVLMAGASVSVNWFDRHESATMHTYVPMAADRVVTDNLTRSLSRNVHGNCYIKHTFTKPDNEVALNLDFFNCKTDENQQIADNSDADVNGDMGGTTTGYVATLDFKHAFSSVWHISAGAKTAFVKIDNGGRYDGWQEGNAVTDNLSSMFDYSENVNSVYSEGRAAFGKVTATLGLRLEQTNTETVFSGNEAADKSGHSSHDIHLFPNMSVMLSLNKADALHLSYSRRIGRPRYSDLNPFIYIFDAITHVGGNIGLHPSLSHDVQLAWSHGSWLRITFNGMFDYGGIMKCYREISDRIVYVSPENLPRHLYASFNVSAVNVRPFKWLRTTLSATVFYNNCHFPLSTGISPNIRFTPMADCKNYVDFSHGWMAELSASVCGPVAYGQAIGGASGNVYLGVRKTVLKGKGNVTVYVRDLFNTSHQKSSILLNGKTAVLSEREYENMRLVGVSFSLNMNYGKTPPQTSPKRGVIDEMKRI